MLRFIVSVVAVALASLAFAQPLTTAFTFQGELKSAGSPATGTYDFKFTLFDAAAGGTQQGSQLCSDNISVSGGKFTVQLDFGAQFAGSQRFLEVWVRPDTGLACADSTGFTIMGPRQSLTAAPNAAYSLNATTAVIATNALQLNGQSASFYTNAANLTTGTIPDARLALSVARLNTTQTFTGTLTFSTPPSFSAAGAPFSVSSTTLVPNLNADLLDGLNSSAFLQSIPNPLTLTGSSATHIIRGENSSPSSGVAGVIGVSTSPSSISQGVYGLSSSTSGRGVFGWATAATGATAGVSGLSASPSGYGVLGESADNAGVRGNGTSTTGPNYGGYFRSDSSSGKGVLGFAAAATGTTYGVYGQSDGNLGYGVYGTGRTGVGGTGNTGVHGIGSDFGAIFESSNPAGTAVIGYSEGLTGGGIGGYFESDSTTGIGVSGFATATSGATYGGEFTSESTSGIGVHGQVLTQTGTTYGGYFETGSSGGTGVYGRVTAASGVTLGVNGESGSPSGVGVRGYASAPSGSIYGVYGRASTATTGYGVYAAGDMGASGVKPFRIDHPQDPANKYLLHYAAESPEVLNIYSGKVTLNQQGEATIDLPPYFASINKDPRYLLTPIGDAMPLLHVAEEISETALADGEKAQPGDHIPTCSFTIAGGAPNAKVSWEVKAVRNDLRVRLHGAPVEREKTGPERGKYQHPEYYGLPQDMAMDDTTAPTLPKPIPHARPAPQLLK